MENIYKTYRTGHYGVTFDNSNSIYFYGGWNDQKYIDYGLLFNVKSLKLIVEQTRDKTLPPGRKDHTLCKIGNNCLLFGGFNSDIHLNDIWILKSNWEWQKLRVNETSNNDDTNVELHDTNDNIPCPRRGHSANVIGSYMYIFGGLYGFTKYLNDLYIYDATQNEWIKPELIGITRPNPRAWHTSNVLDNKQLLIFGGSNGRTSFFNDIWVFDTIGLFWFEVNQYIYSILIIITKTYNITI